VTIEGQGAGVSIVNGNEIDRVFQVLGEADAVFRKLTIEGGTAQDDGTSGKLPGTTVSRGGGVLLQDGAHVTLSKVTLTGNRANGGAGRSGTAGRLDGSPGEAGEGGGLFLSTGTVDLSDSNVSGNNALGGRGGSGFLVSCAYSIPCSFTAGAGAPGGAGAGGGLYILSGNFGVFRSTISGNVSNGGLGGAGGEVIAGPSDGGFQPGASGGTALGAGMFVGAGVLSLRETTVSGNSATGGKGSLGQGSTASPS
jgi:hypothetical protein